MTNPTTTNRQHFAFSSAPASPATRRSSYGGPPPVTPQRITRSAPRAVSHYHSPQTPATNASSPYTPLSLRSFSSNGSTLRTPVSAQHMSLSTSPEVGLYEKNQNEKSLADIAHNWRNRANENGIKVASSQDSQYGDDDGTVVSRALKLLKKKADPHYLESDYNLSESNSPALTHNQNLFVPNFVPTQRRARALSYAAPPRSPLNILPVGPCTPNRKTLVNLNTPPPNASVINKLKIKGSLTDPPAPRRRHVSQPVTSELFDINEDEYAPYPTFSTPSQYGFPIPASDPFNAPTLSTIAEAAYNTYNKPIKSGCSICGLQASTLAILEPCSHPLCSACLTSALNIVNEKDMECSVCRTGVANFHLTSSPAASSSPAPIPRPKFSPSGPSNGLLPSDFDANPFLVRPPQFFERAQGTSTPVTYDSQPTFRSHEPVVLRIDNVPWDITPPGLTAWLKQPVERVHVLLDRKGKTLSHVFVEILSEEAAKAALRTAQNTVLGKGKRARGVTVTRSSQEELMKALFPSWQGHFDGMRPSLAGLPNEAVVSTLQAGLISEGEMQALLHLIRSPDSHFVKVPSLPFYSLISILSKFPADIDSRVFWSGALRDFLYDITYAAIQIVLAHEANLGDPKLLPQLITAGTGCQAFTEHQVSKLSDLVDSCLHDTVASSVNTSHCDLRSSPGSSPSHRSSSGLGRPIRGRVEDRQLEALAREFGVGSELVEALAQRLSAMC